MTAKEAVEQYLGEASESIFDAEELTGPYGGLINIAGLRRKGVAVSARELRGLVNEEFGLSLHLYDFVYALTEWCSEYTGTEERDISIGRRTITRGAIRGHGAHYFCVPRERAVAQISCL